MLPCLKIEFLSLSASCVAFSSICAATFSNMCSTQDDNSSRKLGLRCGCLFPLCVLALRNIPLASFDFLEFVLGFWFHWGFVHCTLLSCLCPTLKTALISFRNGPNSLRCDFSVNYFFPTLKCLLTGHSSDWFRDPINWCFTRWIPGFLPTFS
jgi:hypothetical protein